MELKVLLMGYFSPFSLLPTDDVVIGFDPETYRVREDAGTATLTVRVLRGMLGKEVTVDFTTLPGSSISKSLRRITDIESNVLLTTVSSIILTIRPSLIVIKEQLHIMICSLFSYIAPDDYTTVVQTLTFNPTTSSVDIQVPIINDALLEDDEMFFGMISNPSDNRVTLNPARANVTIEDFGDGKCSVERPFLLLV